jgi:type IV pilus assembly protein PilX
MRRERGVVLFIALIVLVAMTLAGLALMRSVDTNVLIAGNLAFRQGATMAGDWGIEDARLLLQTNTGTGVTTLHNDTPALAQAGGIPNPPWPSTAYYANWQQGFDLTGNTPNPADDFDWTLSRDMGTDAAGNAVRYVIHRLCSAEGDPAAGGMGSADCIKSAGGSGSSTEGTKGVALYGVMGIPGSKVVNYRVTVRVTGPRNTVSYVQAVLN